MKKKRFWRDYEPIEKFTFWLMLATLGLVIVGGLQVWALIRSERAFVFPTDANFDTQLVPGIQNIPMYLTLLNSGRSTATIEELRVAIATDPLSPIPEYGRAADFAVPPIVAGGSIKQHGLRFLTGWAQPVIDQIVNGTYPLYIYGFIRYRDDFSIIAGTKSAGFCFAVVPASDVDHISFRTCPEPAYTYSQ